ncbi:MAG: sulfatase family protein [Planctomycetota bacterium]|jgi:arylsulfatase A-like enzyme
MLNRREFLRAAGSSAAALAVPGCLNGRTGTADRGGERPNILFIMSDDHAFQAMSCYGSRINKTPNLDRIANEGMRFDNCFCTNSICTPSRAVILTGKYSHKNGVLTLSDNFDGSQQTFGKLLQQAGYYTAVIGKWHLKTEPTGFDYYNVLPGQGLYFDPLMKEKGSAWQDGRKGGRVHPGYVTDVITDVALDFLKNRPKDKPFCLLYHHKAPHDMWEYDKKHAHLYQEDVPEPDNLFDDYSNRSEAIKRATQKIGMEETVFLHGTQGDQFDDVRAETANLSGEQKKRRAYQHFIKAYLRCTIVIYTSDQGVFLGEHGLFDKRFMYEESLRMPLIVRYPRQIKAGSASDDIVLNVDFAETFLDYAGAPAPSDMQGGSLRPLLRGDRPKDWRTSMYYRYWMHGAHFNVAGHFGVRTKRYKLIYYYGLPLNAKGAKKKPTPPEWELFDLRKDPKEMRNVYDDPAYSSVVKELKAELVRLRQELEDENDGIVIDVG